MLRISAGSRGRDPGHSIHGPKSHGGHAVVRLQDKVEDVAHILALGGGKHPGNSALPPGPEVLVYVVRQHAGRLRVVGAVQQDVLLAARHGAQIDALQPAGPLHLADDRQEPARRRVLVGTG